MTDAYQQAKEAAVDAMLARWPHVPPTTLHDMLDLAIPFLDRYFRERHAEELEKEAKLRPVGSLVYIARMDSASFLRGTEGA